MKELVDILLYDLKSNTRVKKLDSHSFDSGAFIIDVWGEKSFYCLHIYNHEFGFSKIDNTNDFTSIPDKSFNDFDKFRVYLQKELE